MTVWTNLMILQKAFHSQLLRGLCMAAFLLSLGMNLNCKNGSKTGIQSLNVRTIPPARVIYDNAALNNLSNDVNHSPGDHELPLDAVPRGKLPHSFDESLQAFRCDNVNIVVVRSRVQNDDVVFFDANWRRLGSLTNLPSGRSSRSGTSIIDCKWDAKENLLAALITLPGADQISVGYINIAGKKYVQVLRCSGVEDLGFVPGGSGMIMCYSEYLDRVKSFATRNVVRQISLSDRRNRVLYTEPADVPGHGWFQSTLVSPGGDELAFDRLPRGGEDCGIWPLGLQSGKCKQVTFENGRRYVHNLIRWKSSKQIDCVTMVNGKAVIFSILDLPDMNR